MKKLTILLMIALVTLSAILAGCGGSTPAPAAKAPQVAAERLEQVELERDAALQEIREQRARIADERTKPQHTDAKCVGGILFATVNGELRNVDRCD